MERLRNESLRALRKALVLATADIAEAEGLEPPDISWHDCLHMELGALSWPLPRSLRSISDTLAPRLEKAWSVQECPWLEWRGLKAGFVNFAWSTRGYAEILRLAHSEEPPVAVWQNILHLQRWCASALAARHGEQGVIPEERLAYQRTLELEKMGRNLLAGCHSGNNSSRVESAESIPAGPNSVAQKDQLELLTRIERLVWARQRHPKLVVSQRAQLARLWNRCYERNSMLKGTAKQIEARLRLTRAVRFGLSILV